MAKRAAPDEEPYRPLLDTELVNTALSHSVLHPPANKVVDLHVSDARPLHNEPKIFADHVTSAVRLTQPVVETFDCEKRILLMRSEAQAIDRLVNSLAVRVRAQVKASHVIRALIGLLLHAEGEVDRRAGEVGPLVRPPNGDAHALQRFESEIGKIVAAAIRDAGPLR